MIIIIAAVSKNGVIGNKGKLPWNSKEEMAFFKKTTTGYPVIMGRKTYESLGKPLENRENIIISKSINLNCNNLKSFDSLRKGIEYCRRKKYEKVFIIGGGEIFEQAIEFAGKILISEMKKPYEGDVFFPEIPSGKWNKKLIAGYEDFNLFEYTPTGI